MTSQGYFSFLDHSGETAASSFVVGNITAASLPGFLTEWGDLRDAVDAIVLGTIKEEAAYVFKTKLSNIRPTDQNAQRERKWLVTYEDNLAFFDAPINAIPNAGYRKVFNVEIPTADATLLSATLATEEADITIAPMSDFVAAYEQIGRSPYGGTITVLKVELVGRNL